MPISPDLPIFLPSLLASTVTQATRELLFLPLTRRDRKKGAPNPARPASNCFDTPLCPSFPRFFDQREDTFDTVRIIFPTLRTSDEIKRHVRAFATSVKFCKPFRPTGINSCIKTAPKLTCTRHAFQISRLPSLLFAIYGTAGKYTLLATHSCTPSLLYGCIVLKIKKCVTDS